MTVVDERPAAPAEAPRRRPNRLLALLRNSWRQLTSMRTALVLLFLLAVAAIPGSVLPQRGVNPEDVRDYFVAHPDLAPLLDRIGAFEAFGSVWFSAIYVLLFTSLIGCIAPRLRDHARALRSKPPVAPKRLDRLPQHAVFAVPDGGVEAIAAALRRRRWRVVVRGDEVSAEKGYLKETGNLLFHSSLVVVLVGVALGSWYGWSGNRLLVTGADNSFCNTQQQYAETKFGPRVDSADLPPFCLQLDDFEARFLESNGQPRFFDAKVTVEEDGGTPRQESFSVNSPLRLDGANVYLLGHGYTPLIRYTDRFGVTQISDKPFLSTGDIGLTGEGLADFPDANVDPATGKRDPNLQVAFSGLYLPTAPQEAPFVRSEFPTERNPMLNLVAYRGNLGLDAGIPGSVYELDQRQVTAGKVKEVGAKLLKKGETWTLDDGTTVEFLDTVPYIVLSVRYDPGSTPLLFASGFLLVGLMGSLFVRRRRVFFRVAGADPAGGSPTDGSSLVEAGGLPRTDHPGFADEFASLVAAVGGTEARDQRDGAGRDDDRTAPREGAE
ncbi:cytochrome c biogenesis protein ResB [Micromonospora endolithica]|uniref:Cytochrome c biogenesis protein ResB n=1 Tax=Micromonospora endolithica TaxID=230091 RepID=A0A3A9ZIV9_9ACTN|nr:cytochrome c biogenesis protein ResB [Micromonospora endolithica]RKN48338.1 cytochrome c biogenesis protein ResB [Micromonospora endolithica]TWJ24598.1 cytochrome c biogenesis protein [Micromonospora endolithica]